MENIGQKGFMGMIIKKKYGGKDLSVSKQSAILTKISSYNPSLEFLLWFQFFRTRRTTTTLWNRRTKKLFSTKLANGEYIPCFRLTGLIMVRFNRIHRS